MKYVNISFNWLRFSTTLIVYDYSLFGTLWELTRTGKSKEKKIESHGLGNQKEYCSKEMGDS